MGDVSNAAYDGRNDEARDTLACGDDGDGLVAGSEAEAVAGLGAPAAALAPSAASRSTGSKRSITCLACSGKGYTTAIGPHGPYPVTCRACGGTGTQAVRGG